MPLPATLPLWSDNAPELRLNIFTSDFRPYLKLFLLPEAKESRGVVVVIPGGGYWGRADHEADPVARFYNQQGWHAVVLHYRVRSECQAPLLNGPLCDVQRAIRIVRHYATEWGIRADRVAVLGFSAGGHLATSVTVHNDSGVDKNSTEGLADPIRTQSSRPDASILCYPVISAGPHAHRGSIEALIDTYPQQAPWEAYFCLENWVSEKTPPCFLWSTSDDQAVPVENSLYFAAALAGANVPFAMHVFPKGPHGMGLAEQDPLANKWPSLSADWLRSLAF